jgi:hypothetical protein
MPTPGSRWRWGDEPWSAAVASGRLVASGERSDLSALLPLLGDD